MDKYKEEKPFFEHDCESCKFLGHYKNQDLYFCENEFDSTVIARRSSDGPDYSSGMVFATPDGSAPLYEAKKRAIKLKLYKEKDKNK